MSAGNSRAACMREYKKRKRIEKDNCNNVRKRTKLHAERLREYTETHKIYLVNTCAITENAKHRTELRKNKTSQASASTDPTPT
jgi:tRNA A37 methylthiotransferase MiaB